MFGAEAAVMRSDELSLGLAVLLLTLFGLYLVFMLRTHPELFKSAGGGHEGHAATWGVKVAVGILVAASVGAAFMSEILVGAAEATGEALGMSQAFIGVVLLALIGGAAELGAAVTMGIRNRLDLSIGIALGSCMQIALFVAPVLVLVSYFIAPEPLRLEFGRTAVGALLLSVLMRGGADGPELVQRCTARGGLPGAGPDHVPGAWAESLVANDQYSRKAA
jgi:Ca2+:H+ antiporter